MSNKWLKLNYAIAVVCLLFTQHASAAPTDNDRTAPSRSMYFVLPSLAPELSSDGKTLYRAALPVIYVADLNPSHEVVRIPAPATLLALPESAGATFSITYAPNGGTDLWGQTCHTFPEEAKAAFNTGVNIWSNLLQSPVPITIKVCWADLGSTGGILGYSGGGPLHRDFAGAPRESTWYLGALANSLAGMDLAPDQIDMHLTYNEYFSWYFGTDGNTPSNQHDFMSVVLHEITHGLNFSGSMTYSGGQGSWGHNTGYPNIYDTLMRDGGGNLLIDTGIYGNPSTGLGDALVSTDVWFHGGNAMAANGGQRVKMYAPSVWSAGSSYSHLDYSTFNDTFNELMVYAFSQGESVHDPGPVARGLLKDLGWFTDTAPPVVSAFSIVPPSLALGDAFSISYTVSDSGGAGLKEVELWRATDLNGDGEPDWPSNPVQANPVSGNGPTSGSFSDAPSSTGDYWYDVKVVDNAGNITLEPDPPGPTKVTVLSSCTDPYEPNDSSVQAWGPLISGSSYSGRICSSTDVDWFNLNITSPGAISLSLSVPPSTDYDLELYGPSSTRITGSYKGAGLGEQINYHASEIGAYYIKVYGYDGSFDATNFYGLTHNFAPSCQIPDAFSYTSPGNRATNQTRDVDLDWENSSGANSYDVYFGTANPPPLLTSQTVSYDDPGLLNYGSIYYWKIVAKNGCGERPGSIWSFTTVPCPVPALPSNPYPANGTAGAFTNPTLRWNSLNADSYDVYFGTSSNPPFVINTTEASYTPAALSASTTYYWKIVAKNQCGQSVTGTVWSFKICVALPAPPSIRVPSSDCDGAYTVTWAPANGAASYELQRATNAGFSNGTRIYSGSETFYTENGRLAGKYWYRVRASNSCGNSDWTSEGPCRVGASPRTVSMPETGGHPGQAGIQIPINIDNAKGVSRIEATLAYDPSVLSCTDVQLTSLTTGFSLVKNTTSGWVIISLAKGSGIVSGSGPLVNVICEVSSFASPGDTSPLTVQNLALRDETAEPICSAKQDGLFTVIEPISEKIPDLGIWADTWFKVTLTESTYHYSDLGVAPAPSSKVSMTSAVYMKITRWDSATRTLSASVYGKDPVGTWDPTPYATLGFVYFAGSDLEFVCKSHLESANLTQSALLLFTGQKKNGNFVMGGITNFKTLGGYLVEVNDAPGSPEYWAGSLSVSGSMIPASKVPAVLLGQ